MRNMQADDDLDFTISYNSKEHDRSDNFPFSYDPDKIMFDSYS